MFGLAQPDSARRRWLLIWYGLATVLAIFAYFYGLDSDHIPRNGDELPYAQITRLTAASGHLLPLQAEKKGLENTKPPLLFWQGIASTDWGKHWTLERLRFPSVIYTLLTAALVFLLGWKLSRQLETGFLALLTFLAFFSTYRYGRPFLTDSPLVFWLFVPLFAMLYWRPAMFESRLLAPSLLGLAVGVGLLYKSFAFLLPAAFCFSWWYLRERNYSLRTFLARDAWKIAGLAIISLTVFSLWFLLDPNPQAIFRDFVLKENAGKFDSHGGGYLKNLLWGGSSIWRLVVSYPLNAGLLSFPVIVLFYVAFKHRAELSDEEKLLWIWVGTIFVASALPSQRDERYLLPAMPALAVLCALNWQRIGRQVFNVSLVVTSILLLVMAYLSWRLQQGAPGIRVYAPAYWLLLVGNVVLVIFGLRMPGFTRAAVNIAAILALLSFAAFVRPLDGPLGTYSAEAQHFAKGREVWVPVNYNAVEEGYRFFLPGAYIHAYKYDPNLTLADLSRRYPLFVMRLPMGTSPTNSYGSNVIGQRMYLGTRHTSKQIMQIVQGKVFEYLFLRELLIEAPGSGTNGVARPDGAVQR